MKFSDQTFLFDALWLSVSIWVSVYLFGDKRSLYLLGLLRGTHASAIREARIGPFGHSDKEHRFQIL
jgi:hypothetical protein